jgi:heme o synthase
VRNYLSITKPGIIRGNVITLCGGFFLASRGHIDLLLLLFTAMGMSLVIACGCVLNNILDRDIDLLMTRTKERVIAQGLISKEAAAIYAIILGVLGFLLLYFKTNMLTVLVSSIGLFFYVVVYTISMKRRSPLGTIVGGVSGAIPPVVGYCAVTNRFDLGAVLLFLILFFWQLPHFYAIAIYRLEDYQAASIPVLPATKGMRRTKRSILAYIAVFTVVAVMPAIFGYAGVAYFIVALALGAYWFYTGLKGFKTQSEKPWARKMFLLSIVVIALLCVMMLFS